MQIFQLNKATKTIFIVMSSISKIFAFEPLFILADKSVFINLNENCFLILAHKSTLDINLRG